MDAGLPRGSGRMSTPGSSQQLGLFQTEGCAGAWVFSGSALDALDKCGKCEGLTFVGWDGTRILKRYIW